MKRCGLGSAGVAHEGLREPRRLALVVTGAGGRHGEQRACAIIHNNPA